MTDTEQIAPAVIAATTESGDDGVHILSNGARAILQSVPTGLIEEAQARIQYPDVPKFYNKDMDRLEDNPTDAAYLREVEATDRRRGLVAVDIMLVKGIKLLDGVPDDSEWLDDLHFLEELGHIDLSNYDLANPRTRRYIYLKFVAVSMADLEAVMARSRITQEEYDRAKASFRSN